MEPENRPNPNEPKRPVGRPKIYPPEITDPKELSRLYRETYHQKHHSDNDQRRGVGRPKKYPPEITDPKELRRLYRETYYQKHNIVHDKKRGPKKKYTDEELKQHRMEYYLRRKLNSNN